MKALFIYSALMLFSLSIWAQNTFIVYLRDKKSHEPVIGATANLMSTSIGTASDVNGFALLTGIPSGKQVLCFRSVGYQECYDTVSFPMALSDTGIVYMEASEEDLEEVTISTTRSSRTIQDVPTRVELISGEELGEKANMKPGDIKMVLSESTGIQTLQTSATSGNASIRIEGMDGRYTQVLKDGFPLFAGFSGGLGLMQTPPLDLKRIEIIKGASSTLYGGGAIAGLVNLISKTPSNVQELRFILNGTSAGGLDASGYYSKLWGKVGLTLYAAFNSNEAYAPDNTPFTAIPRFRRYTMNPRLFLYPNKNTDIIIGLNGMYETRIGGDILYIKGHADSVHSYFEDNATERINGTFEIRRRFDNSSTVVLKSSIDHFNRIISASDNTFDGTQTATFSEMNYSVHKNKLEWIFGGNIFTDEFKEKALTLLGRRDYELSTFGAFIQNTWDISREFVLETGLRGDYVNEYGFAPLPKISVLYKNGRGFSSRLGGGLGYKAPTIFTEESERVSYRNIVPVRPEDNKLEHSYGANWDANYKTTFFSGKVNFSINQLFFYTSIANPLVLMLQPNNLYKFENIDGNIESKGAETNMKIGYKHFKLFLGYTYTNSRTYTKTGFVETPLTPKHHTNTVLMYEIDNKLKIGAEAYYYSPQRLSDGLTGKQYWLCGLMAERIWKKCSIYINFENMLDARQTKFDIIYTGTVTHPVFRDIYAPLDGFIANGGIKLNL